MKPAGVWSKIVFHPSWDSTSYLPSVHRVFEFELKRLSMPFFQSYKKYFALNFALKYGFSM